MFVSVASMRSTPASSFLPLSFFIFLMLGSVATFRAQGTRERLCTLIMNTDLSLLKILLLLSFWSHAGTTASPRHYRRKNGSFCLPEKTFPPHDISLYFENIVVIKNSITKGAYKDRMDYDETTFKWCLHQLNETDSGTYKFMVTNNDRVIADGSLTLVVEEAVPMPDIQMQALHSNLSGELCNITVNCSIWGNWVSSVCNGSVCQTSGRSLETVNITVSAGSRSVICSGSNFVSTSNISKTICFNDMPGTPEELELINVILCTVAFLLLLLLLAICAIALYRACMKHQKAARPPQKIQTREAARALSVSSRVSNLSGQSEVAYENVDAVSGGQDHRVDTTYGLVEGPHGASAAQEAKNRGEVETVYSVLQKV